MTINQLHEPMQSAYRACHSTETLLVRVPNNILRILDQGGAAIILLLDLSAAFDTIDHFYLGWSQFLELRELLYSGSIVPARQETED